MHRRGAWSCALLLACAVFASQVSAKTCPPTAKSVQEYLNDSDYTVGKALVPLLGSDPFKGTVFLPTNAALNATLGLILELASNLTGTPVTSLPAGVTLEDIFSNPAFVDVLKLHLLPRALDPTQLVAVNFTNGSYIRRDIPTVLSFQDKPNFCTKAKTDTALLTGEVIGTSGKDITGANITGPANSANGVKITVAGICPGVVHIIDAILLPCGLNDSVVPVLAASLAPPAKSPTSRVLPPGASPAMSPSANNSNTTAAPKSGAAAGAVGMSAVWSAAVMLVLAVVML